MCVCVYVCAICVWCVICGASVCVVCECKKMWLPVTLPQVGVIGTERNFIFSFCTSILFDMLQ